MWMTYLRSTTDDVIQDLAKNDKIFQQLLEVEKAFRGNTSNMGEYSFYESARNKVAFELMQAKAEAIAEAIAEAKAEADLRIKQAEAKATAEADSRVKQAEAKAAEAKAEAAEAVAKATAEADLRIKQAEAKVAEAVAKAKLETAKRLLAMGLSPDAIKEATNLTDSQLAMLTKHQSN